jgi:hypothetical protein
MAALTSEVKTFITQALACFDSPSEVAEAVKREFGITVSRQQCETHDPTKRASKGLGKKWADLFYETRASFKEGKQDIAIANRMYRLRVLGRIATKAEGMRNYALVMQALEQAAKETGDAYVNHKQAVPTDNLQQVLVDLIEKLPS